MVIDVPILVLLMRWWGFERLFDGHFLVKTTRPWTSVCLIPMFLTKASLRAVEVVAWCRVARQWKGMGDEVDPGPSWPQYPSGDSGDRDTFCHQQPLCDSSISSHCPYGLSIQRVANNDPKVYTWRGQPQINNRTHWHCGESVDLLPGFSLVSCWVWVGPEWRGVVAHSWRKPKSFRQILILMEARSRMPESPGESLCWARQPFTF